jgi:hypothetical protein
MASETRLQTQESPSPNAPKHHPESTIHATETESTQMATETDIAWELVKEECHDGLFSPLSPSARADHCSW